MTQEMIDQLTEQFGDLVTIDGYDDCIVGIVRQNSLPPRLGYDRSRILGKLRDESGMEADEAVEHFDCVILGADLGERSPCFIDMPNMRDDE